MFAFLLASLFCSLLSIIAHKAWLSIRVKAKWLRSSARLLCVSLSLVNSLRTKRASLGAMFLQVALGIGISYLSWSLLTMEMNYRRASSMGIPLVRLPVDPLNLFWVVFGDLIWRLLDLLPFSFGSFGRYSRRGWHFLDKADSHIQNGPIWSIVTPRDIYVFIADPDAICEIFNRRTDFLRPSKMYSESARLQYPSFCLMFIRAT